MYEKLFVARQPIHGNSPFCIENESGADRYTLILLFYFVENGWEGNSPNYASWQNVFLTGFENPSVEDGGFPQHTYAEILDVVKPLSLNAKTQLKGNNESRQMAGGISTDEPGEKLQEYPHYQNQNAIERPNPPMDRASYIDMTKGFKEDFEVSSYDDLL